MLNAKLFALVVALAAAGCASKVWARSAAGPADFDRDMARAQAEAVKFAPVGSDGPFTVAARRQEIVEAEMRARGWALVDDPNK